ncbi:MAG: V-type ATP synthase subunit D [Candidatus Micrarchaeota archaeon]|nr:V-type ATP synthase subunit D [Candidatus Micrarchaeota archaeon]
MAENPNPTRMEMLKARSRIKLARKGHKLLKQKRDALIMEFFKIMEKAQDLRSELNAAMSKAYRGMAVAQAYHGVAEVENISMAVEQAPGVGIEVRNIMGLKIPSIEAKVGEKPLLERGYSLVGSSAKIDEAAENFERALVLVVQLAETENAIRKLIREIEKTKRRVNALEYVLIPKLEEQARLISFRLQEMERDSFVMLKTIKRKLKRNAAEKEYKAAMKGRARKVGAA